MKKLLTLLPAIILNLGLTSASVNDLVTHNSFSHSEIVSCLTSIKDTSILVNPFRLDIIAPSSGVKFFRNGLLFLSYSKEAGKMTEKHLSFGTVRPFVAIVSDSVTGEYLPFLPDASVVFPTEATTFPKDYNTMYLSMIPEKKSKEKIFGGAFTKNEWVIESKPLSFCKDNYIYTHPAISGDGKFMIFSSDMNGPSGGLDLYLTRKENNNWSDPVNLGTTINTGGNELFASLDNDNNLYFSSDGLPGLGGYDIFMCRYDGENWGKPENLTSAVNSQNDEIAFTVNTLDAKSAFFTSRPKSARSSGQLFRITMNTDSTASDLSSSLLALSELKPEIRPSDPPAVVSAPVSASVTKAEKPGSASDVRKETIAESRMEQKVQPRTEPKVESKAVPVMQPKPEAKAEPDIQPKAEAKASQAFQPKVEPKSESANQPKVESKVEPVIQPKVEPKPEPKVEARIEPKPEPAVASKHTPAVEVNKGNVVYRVQILANMKPVGIYTLTVAGRSYKTFEYLHAGGYRTTIGEFGNLTEAVDFQNTCRKSGYNQAFVVAFRDNIRTNDPELFKK